MIVSPRLSVLWLFSETLLCSAAGRALVCKNIEDGENMSPSLCLLALAELFEVFSDSSFSDRFFLLTCWLGRTGSVRLALEFPRTLLPLGIAFFNLKLCLGFVHPGSGSSSIVNNCSVGVIGLISVWNQNMNLKFSYSLFVQPYSTIFRSIL